MSAICCLSSLKRRRRASRCSLSTFWSSCRGCSCSRARVCRSANCRRCWDNCSRRSSWRPRSRSCCHCSRWAASSCPARSASSRLRASASPCRAWPCSVLAASSAARACRRRSSSSTPWRCSSPWVPCRPASSFWRRASALNSARQAPRCSPRRARCGYSARRRCRASRASWRPSRAVWRACTHCSPSCAPCQSWSRMRSARVCRS
ncbi:hypothetical protein D9M68_629970 [compost metagenome]